MKKGYILWIGNRPYDRDKVADFFEQHIKNKKFIERIRIDKDPYVYYRYKDENNNCFFRYYNDDDYRIGRMNVDARSDSHFIIDYKDMDATFIGAIS